jgi:hypothetical protein
VLGGVIVVSTPEGDSATEWKRCLAKGNGVLSVFPFADHTIAPSDRGKRALPPPRSPLPAVVGAPANPDSSDIGVSEVADPVRRRFLGLLLIRVDDPP